MGLASILAIGGQAASSRTEHRGGAWEFRALVS
jgi:hypothetical protein